MTTSLCDIIEQNALFYGLMTISLCYIIEQTALFYGLIIFSLGLGFGLILKIFYDDSLKENKR